jgi:hypothetical protein
LFEVVIGLPLGRNANEIGEERKPQTFFHFCSKSKETVEVGDDTGMQNLLGFYAVLTGSWIRGLRTSWDEIKSLEKTESRHNVHSQCARYWQASI